MIFCGRLAVQSAVSRGVWIAITLIVIGPAFSSAKAETFEGPSFRKGLWHFVRTLEVVLSQNSKHRLQEREMTRCVDPTHAMKATFSSASVGNCISATPRKWKNKYTFSNRCDYMGPVSTIITVHSDESYTEVNELSVGNFPRTELVVARRVGDCEDDISSGASISQ
jgi:hypothetical protein